MSGAVAIRLADWTDDNAALRSIRREVFIVEQRIPETIEWDDLDPQSAHVLAADPGGRPIGCGRLLPDGHVGRLAVVAACRGRGVGAALLDALVALARQRGHARAILNAQIRAVPFYERYGFRVTGAEFEEAGIPHVVMERPLRSDGP
jgi:predicted GNAT family N-acyltransferase